MKHEPKGGCLAHGINGAGGGNGSGIGNGGGGGNGSGINSSGGVGGNNGYYSSTSIQKPTNFAFYKANEYLDRKSYISVKDTVEKSPSAESAQEPLEIKPLSGIIGE